MVRNANHRIHVRAGPVHPAAFQTRLHYQLIATFHTAAADRQTLSLEPGVLDLVQSLRQIVQRRLPRFPSSTWVNRPLSREVGQRDQHLGGAMLIVLERVGLLLDPTLGRRGSLAPGHLSRSGQVFDGMGKVQDADCIRTMRVSSAPRHRPCVISVRSCFPWLSSTLVALRATRVFTQLLVL